ncbi:arginine--tRNA ligase [Candidatus Omnitrophota bacterium]
MKKENLCEILLSLTKDYLGTLKLDNLPSLETALEFSSQKEYGDLSINYALKLSSRLRQPPRQIADSLADYLKVRIKETSLKDYISSIQVARAGFINFFLSEIYFREVLKEILTLRGDFGRSSLGAGRKALVEFVSANPTGPLSVAHARQAAVGDALCNILDFLGFKIKREYYLNDEGNQINLLGESIKARFMELLGEPARLPEGGYEGEYVTDIAKQILKEKETAPMREEGLFSEYGASYILGIIKQELDDFGIEFDYWYSQKKLAKSGRIEKVLEELKGKGFIYERESASWFKSTSFGDDKDRVVIKSDGSYTYLTPDLAYHKEKYQRGFSWLINLWGPDHHGYIARVNAAVRALGYPADSLSILIVQLATIFKGGKPLPMSTRQGRYITLREILQEVGVDASRFFFLMRRTSAHLDFDLELAKKQTSENPVYYVQYAHARICSIMRNAGTAQKFRASDLSLLGEPEEINLMKRLWQFPRILELCYKSLDPYFITVYLQEIAEDLHRFYERHRVLSENKDLTNARLALIEAARIVLEKGLSLLGISAPESM